MRSDTRAQGAPAPHRSSAPRPAGGVQPAWPLRSTAAVLLGSMHGLFPLKSQLDVHGLQLLILLPQFEKFLLLLLTVYLRRRQQLYQRVLVGVSKVSALTQGIARSLVLLLIPGVFPVVLELGIGDGLLEFEVAFGIRPQLLPKHLLVDDLPLAALHDGPLPALLQPLHHLLGALFVLA